MRRRLFLELISLVFLDSDNNASAMTVKKNIQEIGRVTDYLKDSELRKREIGDQTLVVTDATISGINFSNVKWCKLHFINCDFIGSYEIKLKELKNTVFEDCRFVGIISWGVAQSVRYVRCKAGGRTIVIDEVGSTDVRFEDCLFSGPDGDRNHWGGIGSRGDAIFLRCKVKWFLLAGYKRINLEGCETEDIRIWTDSEANSGHSYFSASVKIKSSNLRGKFDMSASDLQSVIIQDTNIDFLDMSDAEVEGDVLVERVRGGYLNAGAKNMRKLTISKCQIFGRRRNFSFEIGMDSADEVLLDQCNFGSDLNLAVGLGAGRPLSPEEWSKAPKNRYALIRNCVLPTVDASWLESRHLRLEGNTMESLDISNSRIEKLEVVNNRISLGVNFKNTQVKESTIQPLAKGQAKLDGSNIRLN